MTRTNLKQIQLRSLDEIKNLLQLHKPELSEKWKVKSLGIFGSYPGRGQKEQRPRSAG
jgi:predicted nucleotidyltransferase